MMGFIVKSSSLKVSKITGFIIILLLALTLFSFTTGAEGQVDFLDLCENGTVEEVKEAIADNPNSVSQMDSSGRTPLMIAAKHNSSAVVKVILDNISNQWRAINIQDVDGNSALMYALQAGKDSNASVLLQAGSEVDIENRRGETPLLLAVKNDLELDVIEMMIDRRGEAIAVRDNNERTPLMIALSNGRDDIVREFLSIRGNIEWLNWRDREGKNALMYALENDISCSVIEKMLERGVDVIITDARRNNPLMYAAANTRSISLGERLISDYGLDVNEENRDGETALILAIREGGRDFTELLLDKGASVTKSDKQGKTPLHYAALHWDDPEIFNMLIHRGANVNARDYRRRTPLMLAAQNTSSEDVIFTLLGHDAEPAPRDINGKRTVEYLEENDELWATEAYWELNYLEPEKNRKEPADFKSRKAAGMWAAAVPSAGHAYTESWWPRGFLFLLAESGLVVGAVNSEDNRNIWLGLLAGVKAWEIYDSIEQVGGYNEFISEYNYRVREFNKVVEESK